MASLKQLVKLAGLTRKSGSESAMVRVKAIGIILDRAYGRPRQMIGSDLESPFQELVDSLNGLTRGVRGQSQ